MSEQEREIFANEVRKGLCASNKYLSSKWFYDKIGDELFVKIMNMPEYYLTDCEFEILSEQTEEVIKSFGMSADFDLYELGAGDGTKTIELLKGLDGSKFTYRPIDISQNAINKLVKRINQELPSVAIKGQKGEYFEVLTSLTTQKPKVILFMGSNIGNLLDDQAHDFLIRLSLAMNAGDKLLMGVDLKKSKDIVLPAYNDAQGYTAAFNLNLLDRINKELNANFDRSQFVHTPIYDAQNGWAKSFVTSANDQEVDIGYLGKSFHFRKDESIFMEVSRKYDRETILEITRDTRLYLTNEFFDGRRYFCDVVFEKA